MESVEDDGIDLDERVQRIAQGVSRRSVVLFPGGVMLAEAGGRVDWRAGA